MSAAAAQLAISPAQPHRESKAKLMQSLLTGQKKKRRENLHPDFLLGSVGVLGSEGWGAGEIPAGV